MKLLLDTCVLSEARRPTPHPGVVRALEEFQDEELYVSVLSIGEIAKGIGLLRESPRKRILEFWLAGLERHYAERIIPIDLEICRIWGELTAAAQRVGRVVPAIDGLIAATALRHNLHVVTRDTADFEPTGVALLNPWDT